MKDRIIGQVKRVNGPVIEAMGITDAEMFELVRVLLRTTLFMVLVCSFRLN